LPKINVKLEKYKNKTTSKSSKTSSRSTRTAQQKTAAIAQKINETKHDFGVQIKPKEMSRSFIKSMIKQTAEQKLLDKKPKPIIKFSGDKPTFDVSLLNFDERSSTAVDEKFLMDKAKALQNKLMEFNVPITIE
jgi:hypothetical protein